MNTWPCKCGNISKSTGKECWYCGGFDPNLTFSFFDVATQPKRDIDALRAFELTPKPSNEVPAPIDDFELSLSDKPFQLMSDVELESLVGTTLLFDIESYENYFLVAFKSFVTGKVIVFEDDDTGKVLDRHKLLWVLNNFAIVGFGSKDYDIPMVRVALQGYGHRFLYAVTRWIIFDQISPWQVEQKYNLVAHSFNHVDLIEVAPLQGSLKLYAGRLHCKRMQDLPYAPDAILTVEERVRLMVYCINDLDNTELLLKELAPQLELRAAMSNRYGIDVRSRSDAQIAEYVFASEIEKINGSKPKRPDILPGKVYYYTPPPFIKYKTPQFQEMLEIVRAASFIVDENGKIEMPKEIGNLKLKLGCCVYRMGIGGLHSSEKSIAHIANEDTLLQDTDVASYYPSIILNGKLAPKHLGNAFLAVYRVLVNDRLDSKAKVAWCDEELKKLKVKPEGYSDKDAKQYYLWLVECKAIAQVGADSGKIIINGSFGKLGSKWSVLFAPDLMIQVTVTGQLSLLLLIEMIENVGIQVISANTDGVLTKCAKANSHLLQDVIKQWEAVTGFVTESNQYKAVYSRDVNNYIGISADPKKAPKLKGSYSEKGSGGNTVLSKNAENLVCTDAVLAYLTKGVAIEDTIRGCTDVRRFVTVRNVTGGAVKSNVYLGKTIRWYYSTQMFGQIERRVNGNKVPNSDRAMPLMELPETLPGDLDYERYIQVAKEILVDVGLHTGTTAASF